MVGFQGNRLQLLHSVVLGTLVDTSYQRRELSARVMFPETFLSHKRLGNSANTRGQASHSLAGQLSQLFESSISISSSVNSVIIVPTSKIIVNLSPVAEDDLVSGSFINA